MSESALPPEGTVIETEIPSDNRQSFWAKLGQKVVVEVIVKGGSYVVGKAYEAATRTPVLDFERPPVLYNEASGTLFRLQPNGTYLPGGTGIS